MHLQRNKFTFLVENVMCNKKMKTLSKIKNKNKLIYLPESNGVKL